MAKMSGFVFQDKYLVRLEKLSDQEVGRLVRALAVYHATGETQELKGRECGYYDFIKADIDEIEHRYSAKCETNRNNRQQSSTIVNDRQRSSTNDSDGEQSSDFVPKYKLKEKEKYITNTTTAHARESAFGEVEVDPVIVYVQQNLNELTVNHYDELTWFKEKLPDDLIMHAIDEAVGNGVRNWAYVRAILDGYVKNGIRTVGEAKEKKEKRKKQSPAHQVSAQQYTQRDYTEEELEARIRSI